MSWQTVGLLLGCGGLVLGGAALHLIEPHQAGEAITGIVFWLIGKYAPVPGTKPNGEVTK